MPGLILYLMSIRLSLSGRAVRRSVNFFLDNIFVARIQTARSQATVSNNVELCLPAEDSLVFLPTILARRGTMVTTDSDSILETGRKDLPRHRR